MKKIVPRNKFNPHLISRHLLHEIPDHYKPSRLINKRLFIMLFFLAFLSDNLPGKICFFSSSRYVCLAEKRKMCFEGKKGKYILLKLRLLLTIFACFNKKNGPS